MGNSGGIGHHVAAGDRTVASISTRCRLAVTDRTRFGGRKLQHPQVIACLDRLPARAFGPPYLRPRLSAPWPRPLDFGLLTSDFGLCALDLGRRTSDLLPIAIRGAVEGDVGEAAVDVGDARGGGRVERNRGGFRVDLPGGVRAGKGIDGQRAQVFLFHQFF